MGFGSARPQVSEAAWVMQRKDSSSQTAATSTLALFGLRLRFMAYAELGSRDAQSNVLQETEGHFLASVAQTTWLTAAPGPPPWLLPPQERDLLLPV